MQLPPKPIDPANILPWENGFERIACQGNEPGVSIVIPVYNAGAFIEKTLRSLALNDLTGCEIILMDGGSSDQTVRISRHYEYLFTKIVSEKDEGQSDAINKGFAFATKPILYWLNGDDIILPNALTRIRRAFLENPDTEVMVGNAFMTEIDFKPIRHFKFSAEKLTYSHLIEYARNHLVQPSVFFTVGAWNKCGPTKRDLHYAMDADLFIAMSKVCKFQAIDIDVAYSVYHEDCKTRGKRAESIVELATVQANHGGNEAARSTLNVLIHEFNAIKKQVEEFNLNSRVNDSSVERMLKARIQALENERVKNMELAMLAHIQEA